MTETSGASGPVARIGSCLRYGDQMKTEVETIEIVNAEDADFKARRISAESPIGRALLGCRAGQSVTVRTPGGPRLLHLLEVVPTSSTKRERANLGEA